MSRLPVVNYRKMNAVLARLGFEITRQKGSHVFYRHNDGRTTTVPNHPGRDLPKPLIRKILQDIDLSVDEFQDELDEILDEI
jgi:predicted RNA binding protein YcfA (HicA-like mRNA interferase family)